VIPLVPNRRVWMCKCRQPPKVHLWQLWVLHFLSDLSGMRVTAFTGEFGLVVSMFSSPKRMRFC